MNQVRLRDLVRPLQPAAFLTRHWIPGRPYLSKASSDIIRRLRQVPALRDRDALIAANHEVVALFGPNKFRAHCSPTEASKFLRQGFTLYLSNLERSIPELQELVEALDEDLGTEGGFVFEAFIANDNSVSSAHYDHDTNFQILLEGTKHWKLAENRHILNPLRPYHPQPRARDGRIVGFREEAFAVDPAIPTEIPAKHETLVAEAGSVLFIPHGYWHETKSSGACFGFNIVLKASSWGEGLANALWQRLQSDPIARRHILGASTRHRVLDRYVEETFALVRDRAIEMLRAMSADDVFEHMVRQSFAWTDSARERTLRRGRAGWQLRAPGVLAKPFAVDESLVPILERIVRFQFPFTWPHVLHVGREVIGKSVKTRAVWNLLMELHAHDLIEFVTPELRGGFDASGPG